MSFFNSIGFVIIIPSPVKNISGLGLLLTIIVVASCYSYPPPTPIQVGSHGHNHNHHQPSGLVIVQQEIISIKSEIHTFITSFQFDMSNAHAQLSLIYAKLEKHWKALEELQVQVAALLIAVATVEEEVKNLTEQVTTLEGDNKLWKQNFQVVNRTFTILRKSGCLKP